MKKRVLLTACIIIIAALGIVFLQRGDTDEKNPSSIHELQDILVYAEDKGKEYAADRIDYLIVYNYAKEDLHRKWGAPTEIVTDSNEDIWQLSERYRLVIGYNTDGKVEKIEVLPLM